MNVASVTSSIVVWRNILLCDRLRLLLDLHILFTLTYHFRVIKNNHHDTQDIKIAIENITICRKKL